MMKTKNQEIRSFLHASLFGIRLQVKILANRLLKLFTLKKLLLRKSSKNLMQNRVYLSWSDSRTAQTNQHPAENN